MALRGHKQPLQGASETSALGACGKELIQGLRGHFKWSWGWRYRLAGTQSSPRVGYGASALRVMAQEVPTHVNKLLVGWRCLCTPALGQYHASPRPRTASLAHALAAPQQGRHVTLPALLVEEVGSVGLVRRGLHLPRWISALLTSACGHERGHNGPASAVGLPTRSRLTRQLIHD